MKSNLNHIITRYIRSNYLSGVFQVLGFSLALFLLLESFISSYSIIGALGFFCFGLIYFLSKTSTKKTNLEKGLIQYLHQSYPDLQFSLELLQREPQNDLEIIQKERVDSALAKSSSSIKIPQKHWFDVFKSAGSVLVFSLCVYLIPFSTPFKVLEKKISSIESSNELIQKATLDSISIKVTPPRYTLSPVQEWVINAELEQHQSVIPENALVEIKPHFSKKSTVIKWLDAVTNKIETNSLQFKKVIKNTSAFQIQAEFSDRTIQSSIIAFSVSKDKAPKLIVKKPVFSRTEFLEPIDIPVIVDLSDDYKLQSVQMKITLARGTGENVRFRELSQSMNASPKFPSKKATASFTIKPLKWEMEPGDELYFYVEATDNKPDPNRSRTDTYFVLWRDSTQQFTEITAKVAVNLVPDFFRSQRQIIIDTEKLLNDRARLSVKEFNAQSQEIAYNQQLLRLRYGQYLGLEDEGMAHSSSSDSMDEDGHTEEHHEEEIDPETGLTEAKSSTMASIASNLVHKHEDPEMNTFIKEAPRYLLKKSLDNMWQSELYLRLYEPKKALPFEYEALKYLKEVQQSGRVYVRKAGTAVTPIVESEMRLKGELKGIQSKVNQQKETDVEQEALQSLLILIKKSQQQRVLQEQVVQELKESVSYIKSREKQVQWIQALTILESNWDESKANWIEKEIESMLNSTISFGLNKSLTEEEKAYLKWFDTSIGESK